MIVAARRAAGGPLSRRAHRRGRGPAHHLCHRRRDGRGARRSGAAHRARRDRRAAAADLRLGEQGPLTMPATLTHWRRRVGAFIGGFEAGLANRRLKGFQPSRAHLNTLIAAAGADITARARWLVRNNGYAANAIESWAGNVVGAGIKPSSLIADAGAEGRGAEAVAGVDRRSRRRGLHRLLRPAAPRRPRGVHRRRGVLPLPAAPARGRPGRAAAAADDSRPRCCR